MPKQIADFKRLSGGGKQLCVLGDYNLSFADNYYFTRQGRKEVLQCFSENDITLLTKDCAECIDHIAVSSSFWGGTTVHIEEWNSDKRLLDHKGIWIEF